MATLNRKAGELRRLQTITLGDLLEYPFKQREYLLYPWLRQGESAMVWAQTGLGKTMVVLTAALAVGGGGSFLNWSNETPRRVLLVDGEMHAEDLKDRLRLLSGAVDGIDTDAAGANITILSRQFQNGEAVFPDLASPDGQTKLRAMIREARAELVIIDNFSTCAEVADENEAAAMTPVLAFLLSLKQAGVACILVHHSGKTGASYRGSSKLATTFEAILGLKPWEGAAAGTGTAFETEWTKFRGQPHEGVKAAMVRLETGADGAVAWTAAPSDTDKVQRLISVAELCECATGAEVAERLGWSPGEVSKIKSRGIRAGKLTEADWNRWLQDGASGRSNGDF